MKCYQKCEHLTIPTFFRWADQCPVDHDVNRLSPGFDYVGQNMASFWSSAVLPNKVVENMVQMWYDEV
jgi:hypothetical protein